MRAWIVKEGVKAQAVKFNGLQNPKIESKVIKKEVMYFEEDVAIDPIGKFGCGPQYSKTIGGDWARKGFYGFKLPNNKSGWDIMLVHANDIEVV